MVLITGNRNKDGADSLAATIQVFGENTSLPVMTLADSKLVNVSNAYANRVVDRMLRYLLDIENVRGTGRLWLP
jgi:hypothetical protein